VTVWFLSIQEFFRRVKPKMLFYVGLRAWVNGGHERGSPQIYAKNQVFAADYADRRRFRKEAG
jgi:hypothetical protein